LDKFFIHIILLFASITTTNAQWLCPWENRNPIAITETSGSNLTNYQVRLDVAFATGMNADFSDLRFTSNDGTTLLDYWIEMSIPSTNAIVWVEIPSLVANSEIGIYMYYCNPVAISASNGSNTFVFFDHFDSLQGWTDYGTGDLVSDNTTIPGTSLLAKINNCDPNGGFKPLGTTLSEFRMISREIRLDESGNTCAWNRYGLENDDYDGYTIRRLADSPNNGQRFGYERRNDGSATNTNEANMNHPQEIWYRSELRRCNATTNNITSVLYNDDRSVIGTVNGTDQTYSSFDRVTVRGGRPYYFDFIAVANFTCSDPVYSLGTLEKDLPTAVCQNITVQLDNTGIAMLLPDEVDDGSSDDCGIDNMTLSQDEFDCTHLGGNNVTLTVTDLHGNMASCSATVRVADLIDPIITCPDNIVLEANNAGCTALVNWTDPIATDNCVTVDFNSIHSSGDAFPVGETVVQYLAKDGTGNSSSCTFTVTVENNLSVPTINIADNSGLTNDDGIICAGELAMLSVSTSHAAYSWSNGASTQTTTVNTTGNYVLVIKDGIGCTNSSDVDITVNQLPTAGTCNLIPDLCQENTGGVTIKANDGLAPYTVSWTPNVGSSNTQTIPNDGGQLNITNIPGGNTINISVTDSNGCTID